MNHSVRLHRWLLLASVLGKAASSRHNPKRWPRTGITVAATLIGLRRYAVCRVKRPAKCCLLRTATMTHRITTKTASGIPAGAIKV